MSDSNQLLAEERAAEQQLADRALWDRARAANSEPNEQRVQAVLDRIKAIESAGFPSSDLTRAQTVLQSLITPDAPLAIAERTAAVAARQAAVHAREAAVKALSASLDQVEKTRKAQRQDIAAIEGFLTDQEKKKGAPTAESSAPTEAVAPVQAGRPAPAAAAGVWSPEMSLDTPLAVAPAPAAKAPPKAAPAPAPRPAAAAPAARPMVEAPSTMSTGTMRKLSKRRRVRTAPPPKKLEVEVATWGDNTFYTGFDNRIASGGLFVTSLETLPAGHELDLKIDLDGKVISVRGRVEFTRRDNPSNPDCTSGAGIKLLNLPGDAASAIETFFKEREPLFISPSH